MLVELIQRISGWWGGGGQSDARKREDDFRASEPVLHELSVTKGSTANVLVGQVNGSVRVVHLKQERHVTINKYASENPEPGSESLKSYRSMPKRGNKFMLSKDQFRPGFDWVYRELNFPNDQREALFNAVYLNLYDGLERRLKAIRSVWPVEASWPSGHSFLQEQLREELEDDDEWTAGDPLPDVPNRDLFRLLLGRFTQISQRIYRNAQVHDWFSDQSSRKRRPAIVMNRDPMEEHAWCGRGTNVILSAEEGLKLMEQLACEHPACRCTFDPSRGTA